VKSLLLLAALAATAPAEAEPTGDERNGATAQAQKPPIDLRSETLVVEHARRRAVFGGGVTAVRGDLTLTCPEVVATYDAGSQVREVACQGPVTATQGDRTMTAQRGVFDNSTGLLTLEGEPTLTEGERRLVGATLVYDANARTANLTDATGELPAAEAPDLPGAAGRGPLVVKAARILHDLANQRTTFDGGITATRGNLTLTAPRLVARYDDEGELASAATSGGKVRVVQGERRGQANHATFTGGARTLVLTGEPQITENASSLTGTKVTFLLGQDRVVVDQPRAIFPLKAAGVSR